MHVQNSFCDYLSNQYISMDFIFDSQNIYCNTKESDMEISGDTNFLADASN